MFLKYICIVDHKKSVFFAYSFCVENLSNNENSALIGSANFTWSGIAERGNWECLLHYKRVENETIYAETLSVAEAYFGNGARYEQCEELTIRKAMEYRLVDEPVVSLEDMARYLEVVKSRI